LLDVIRIRGLKITFFFKTLKKISKKILLGSLQLLKSDYNSLITMSFFILLK